MRTDMKKAKKSQIKRIKNLLEIVHIYLSKNQIIESNWLLDKLDDFVSKNGIFELKLDISLFRAMIKSKQYENKLLESQKLFGAGIT